MLERIGFFLWLWMFFGIGQIRVKRARNRTPTLAPIHSVFTIVAVVHCILTVLSGAEEVYETMFEDSVLKMRKGRVMFSVDIAMVSCTVTSGIWSSIYYRREFMKILLDLESVECYLRQGSGTKSPTPKYLIVLYILNLVVMSFTLAYDWWAWAQFDYFNWSYGFSYFSFIVATALILKYVYVVSCVKEQFEKINQTFRETLGIVNEQMNVIDNRRFIYTKIRMSYLNHLVLVHDKLYQTIAEINLVFGLQNIFALLYLMEQMVCCPFYSITNRQLFDSNTKGTEHFIYLYLLWTVAVLFQLISVLYGCSKVKQEALELRTIIARHFNPLRAIDFPDDYIVLYLMKLNKPYPGFTVFGMVELGMPLARSMIAASMTYLVIFLQF